MAAIKPGPSGRVNGNNTPVKPLSKADTELQTKVDALAKELMVAKTEKAKVVKVGLQQYDRAERKEEELKEKTEEVQGLKIKFEALGGEKAYEDNVRRKYGMLKMSKARVLVVVSPRLCKVMGSMLDVEGRPRGIMT